MVKTLFILVCCFQLSVLGQGFSIINDGDVCPLRCCDVGVQHSVEFPSSATYVNRNGPLTGAVDNKTGTMAVWVKTTQNTFLAKEYYGLGGLQILGNNTVYVSAITSPALAFQLQMDSSGCSINAKDGNWHHIMVSWDLSDINKKHLYIDGVNCLTTVTTYNDANITWTAPDWIIGSGTATDVKVYDTWMDNSYIDLSIAGNREKFRSATGCPVYLGANGELPTGTSPLVHFWKQVPNWAQNQGTGGGFTENGIIVDGGGDNPTCNP